MIKTLSKILKYFFIFLGAVVTVNSVALFFVSNINTGLFLALFLGVAILTAALLPEKTLKKIPKWIKIIFIIGICIVIAFVSFLIIYGTNDRTDFKEDAIIVLGAGVHGKTPSLSLKRRLDKAIEYHEKNPEALIVVSGGQGPQEDITEAEAMETYLLEKGVPLDKIIREEKADSTFTNFKYSKEILDKKLGDGYKIAFITNEYHTFRSYICAKDAEFENVTHFHSSTTLSYLIAGTTRECLAVIKYTLL